MLSLSEERRWLPWRRRAKTDRMADGIVRLLAPITAFTAEEVWQVLGGAADDSVMFQVWHELPKPAGEGDLLAKWALIRAGFRDERTIACSSKAEAQRVADFVKPMDDYAVVVVREAVVLVYTAQSQSMRAMGKKSFQESKQAVLDALDALLGVDAGETAENAARAA